MEDESSRRLADENAALRRRVLLLEREVWRLRSRLERKRRPYPKDGHFYVVRLQPDVAPWRLKLGWAKSAQVRLLDHRCAAPRAELLAYWDCARSREGTVIYQLTRAGCRPVSREVFDVDDVGGLLTRARTIFGTADLSRDADLFRDNAAGQVGL